MNNAMRDIWRGLPALPEKGKKYIIGLKIDSIAIYFETLKENVYVTAFVRNEAEEIDPRIRMELSTNKKIIPFSDIEDDAVVLCPENIENIEAIEIQAREKRCKLYKIAVYRLADEIINNKVAIYGTGNRGKKTLALLRENNVNVIGFLDSDQSKIGNKIEDLQVLDLKSIDSDTVIVISSGSYKEVYNKICHVEQTIFVDYKSIHYAVFGIFGPYILIRTDDVNKIDIIWVYSESFFRFIRDVLDKNIIIDGYADYGKDLIRILSLMDKKVEYCIEDEGCVIEDKAIVVKNKYDLIYEDLSDIMILITKLDKNVNTFDANSVICRETFELEELGLKQNKNYKVLGVMEGGVIYPKSMGKEDYVHYLNAFDPLLTCTSIYPESDKKYLQYIVYGNPNTAKCRILTLGGSTTDGGYYYPIKSWPQLLYEKIETNDVVIFNGGIMSYSSGRECLKLLRDIELINPDIVISYSGINEVNRSVMDKHPFLNEYYMDCLKIGKEDVDLGMDNSESKSLFWIRMEKTMKAICQVHGCVFVGILQPSLYNKLFLEDKEILIYSCNIRKKPPHDISPIIDECEAYRILSNEIKASKEFIEDSSLFDFTDIFKFSKAKIFMDHCHVYEGGNNIIAEEIYKILHNYYLVYE